MSDLISRQAAIEALGERPMVLTGGDYELGKQEQYVRNLLAIENVPSAHPEQRWIPVSERMPEPRIDVWCNSDMGQMVGYYDEYAETWYGRDYLELIVTAWMPLPPSYQGEENG